MAGNIHHQSRINKKQKHNRGKIASYKIKNSGNDLFLQLLIVLNITIALEQTALHLQNVLADRSEVDRGDLYT